MASQGVVRIGRRNVWVGPRVETRGEARRQADKAATMYRYLPGGRSRTGKVVVVIARTYRRG